MRSKLALCLLLASCGGPTAVKECTFTDLTVETCNPDITQALCTIYQSGAFYGIEDCWTQYQGKVVECTTHCN